MLKKNNFVVSAEKKVVFLAEVKVFKCIYPRYQKLEIGTSKI